ncbi:MAG TPA: sigma-54 dependent transcriptional regulator [Rhodocyclaceae bacterium]|nr:sigma-54 dependent transcriptional regulator [Rhodocyclaceae bacterium]
MSGRLLVVDDERIALANLKHVLGKAGYDVTATSSGARALEMLDEQSFDAVLTDLRMEQVDGMQVLRHCRERGVDAEVIVITGFATPESAVEAMREGAFYYIVKPFRLDEVRKVVAEAVEKSRLRRENRDLRSRLDSLEGRGRIVTQDETMLRLLDTARQVAPTDCNVLVVGDTGTGKELLARHVHDASRRARGPFVAINCGAFSEDLLANELFGHEKGAYTGATGQKTGLVEAAQGGTLFLDEVTEMTPAMQVKLLRLLQEREFLRLGASAPVPADVRFVAATNRDPQQAVKDGVFRQDLYFRLNVVTLKLPALAARKADIPLLCASFLHRYSALMGKEVEAVAPEALDLLMAYDFPGNVRELENLIERGVAVATSGRIEAAHLPEEVRGAGAPAPRGRDGTILTLEEMERNYIRWVLDELGGNQQAAAQRLGIDRVTLWRKLKRYALE